MIVEGIETALPDRKNVRYFWDLQPDDGGAPMRIAVLRSEVADVVDREPGRYREYTEGEAIPRPAYLDACP